MHEAFVTAGSSHRGPVFVDIPMDELFNAGTGALPDVAARAAPLPTPMPWPRWPGCSAARSAQCSSGTDVWADRAEEAALRFVEATGTPAITNGMGRGSSPAATRSW